jgi:uncharacterized RDD family membrane protein YckC
MPTFTPTLVEFRCTRCWYSNCADAEAVGTEVGCRNCGQKLEVPEATPERIERALALLETEPELLSPREDTSRQVLDFHRVYSDQEMYEIARKASYVPLNQMNFQGYPLASAWGRLFAYIIDCAIVAISCVLGVFVISWLAKQGMPIDDPIAIVRRQQELNGNMLAMLMLAPGFFILLQWYLLAVSGQTLGKKLLMMRIVTDDGELPGFVRAVVLRSWVCYFICAVPIVGRWFGFLDSLFIFSASRKCLHDHVAGTRVVSLV